MIIHRGTDVRLLFCIGENEHARFKNVLHSRKKKKYTGFK